MTPHPTLPSAPGNLTATAGDGEVLLSWNPSAGARSYSVHRRPALASEGERQLLASELPSTSFTDTGLINGSTYSYVVRASNASGESPPSNEASATPTQAQPLNEAAIEPGRPADGAAAAQLIADTDVALFSLYGGGDLDLWRSIARVEWRSERGIYTHKLSHVVRLGEMVVGLLISYSPKEEEETNIDWSLGCSRAELSIEPGRWAQLDAVRSQAKFLFPAIPKDAYYVQNVVTDPTRARGRGFGRRFMKLAFDRGRALGCQSCHLDVGSNNPAVDFYQDLGMYVAVETSIPWLLRRGIPSHYRMVKRLCRSTGSGRD
jgi:ribosomal protein S18 acetylase RimI-like enzyme